MRKSLHQGDPCFACGTLLQENDDIVVCPECGTPYHRDCWKKNGACLNLPLHASGGSYESEQARHNEAETPIICLNCGTENTRDSKTCKNCGASLGDTLQRPSWESNDTQGDESFRDRIRLAAEQMSLEKEANYQKEDVMLDGESAADISAFVQKNIMYYLPRFSRFRDGHRFSINFPCLFFPQLYLAYRKMWPLAILITFLFAILNFPQEAILLADYLHEFSSAAAESYPDLVQTFDTMAENLENHTQFFYNASLICEWLDLCLSVVLGVFGNYFYYRFVLRRVKKAREETPDAAVRQNLLRMKGGVNGWLILGMLVLSYVVSCALIFILMLVLFAS